MTQLFLTRLGTDLQNVAVTLGVNISNVVSHLAAFLGGTVRGYET